MRFTSAAGGELCWNMNITSQQRVYNCLNWKTFVVRVPMPAMLCWASRLKPGSLCAGRSASAPSRSKRSQMLSACIRATLELHRQQPCIARLLPVHRVNMICHAGRGTIMLAPTMHAATLQKSETELGCQHVAWYLSHSTTHGVEPS